MTICVLCLHLIAIAIGAGCQPDCTGRKEDWAHLEYHGVAADICADSERLDQDVWLGRGRCLICRILLGGADVLCEFSIEFKCHDVQPCAAIVQDIVEQHCAMTAGVLSALQG